MIYFLLLFTSLIIHCQGNTSCDICIIDAICTDDKISFNVSISKQCPRPLHTHFTYHTEIYPKLHHYNTTITCSDCYIDISIDPIQQAWDYTLTLDLPELSKICPHQHVAHCGGDGSRLSWVILSGLSGLSVLFGTLVCSIKYYRGRKRSISTKTETSIINA